MVDFIKALNEATTTAGGYLVPEEFAARFYDLIMNKAVTLPDTEQVTMNTDKMHIPTVTTGSTAYFVAENATITAADLAFGRVTLDTQKVAALVPLSSELWEDSNPSVANIIMEQMTRDLALKIDNEILNGTAGGAWVGYRSNTLVNTVAATTNGDAITVDKIMDAVCELEKDNHAPDTLYVHPRTLGAVRKLKDTNSNYLFTEFTLGSPFLRDAAIGTLCGLKVKPTNQLPTNVTKGSSTACTDLVVIESKTAGLFGTRRQLRLERFYDINTDSWKLAANMRNAFTIKYPNAICIIKDITS